MTKRFDAVIIGSGMGSLAAACLMARHGLKVVILEQNYLPGGCTSSYWRKGFVFETGATTLVGLDDGMSLRYLLDTLDIEMPVRKLDLPMRVILEDGEILNRYEGLNDWITEAQRVFGREGQQAFWELCYKISQEVWQASTKQTTFPPTHWRDVIPLIKQVSLRQFRLLPYAYMTMDQLLAKFNLDQNERFKSFVNEQLLITAQNYAHEVNVLFGATALCYTNFSNYYVDGGLINLVNPLVNYVKEQGGEVYLRTSVESVKKVAEEYHVSTDKNGNFKADFLIGGIPVNNAIDIFPESFSAEKRGRLLPSKHLASAFQMGIGHNYTCDLPSLHHQIHLATPLPYIGSRSIFVSQNHPEDHHRTHDESGSVLSVSTHIQDPEKLFLAENHIEEIEGFIISELENRGFVKKKEIVYQHSSTQKSWEKWTKRKFGFVGGYPQFKHTKPWQMLDARWDAHKAYLCGDTVYPGQGIPGVTLSGIIAFEKLKRDWL